MNANKLSSKLHTAVSVAFSYLRQCRMKTALTASDVEIAYPGYLQTSYRCVFYLVFTTFRRLIDGSVPFN